MEPEESLQQRLSREREERTAKKKLEGFTREMDGQGRGPRITNPERREEVRRSFQESRAPQRREEKKVVPQAPHTLPVVIVVNGEFKTALFHYSGEVAPVVP